MLVPRMRVQVGGSVFRWRGEGVGAVEGSVGEKCWNGNGRREGWEKEFCGRLVGDGED